MLLNLLKESNKKLFLKICVHASLSNGVFDEKEKEMIYAYCREMNIAEYIPDLTDDFDHVVDSLATQADDTEKNIIVLEILGLVKSDGIYDEKEETFMKKLMEGMKVKEDVLSKFNGLLDIYTSVYKVIYEAVCG